MSNETAGFNLVRGIVEDTSIGTVGANYFIILALVAVCCLLVSPRKPSNMKTLMFPMIVGFIGAGFKVPTLYLGITGIIFIMDILTFKGVGDIIEAVSTKITSVGSDVEYIRDRPLRKMRKDIERESISLKRRKLFDDSPELKNIRRLNKQSTSNSVLPIERSMRLVEKSKKRFSDEYYYKRNKAKKGLEVDE